MLLRTSLRRFLVWTYVFTSFDCICFGVEFSGPYGDCMFNFSRNCQAVFRSGRAILHPQRQCVRVPADFSSSSPALGSVCLSGHGHPRGRVVVITWFSFAFSSWLVMLSIFPCLYWPFVYLPWRDVFSILCPFFTGWFVFLLLGCKCSLYILDTRPLSDTRFAHTLSHSVYHLFTFPIASSEARKFLVLMKSDLSIFYLVPYV